MKLELTTLDQESHAPLTEPARCYWFFCSVWLVQSPRNANSGIGEDDAKHVFIHAEEEEKEEEDVFALKGNLL